MEIIHKLETALAVQYDKLPHLPVGGRKWLAENIWWIVLIGVILSAIALVGTLIALVLAAIGLSFAGATVAGASGAVAGFALGGILLLVTIITLALFLVVTILLCMAISPLKQLKKRGWDLVFIVIVLNVAVAVITNVLSANIVGLFFQVLWMAVGAYFLFEVREYFIVKNLSTKTAPGFKSETKAKA